jgi:hypothetical protein
MRGDNHNFWKKEIDLFFAKGLDKANQVECAGEIRFFARVLYEQSDLFAFCFFMRCGRVSRASCRSYACHRPPPGLASGEPDDRLRRTIQYAAAFDALQLRLWNTGCPACAGHDD